MVGVSTILRAKSAVGWPTGAGTDEIGRVIDHPWLDASVT
jgi:hypothetical protein